MSKSKVTIQNITINKEKMIATSYYDKLDNYHYLILLTDLNEKEVYAHTNKMTKIIETSLNKGTNDVYFIDINNGVKCEIVKMDLIEANENNDYVKVYELALFINGVQFKTKDQFLNEADFISIILKKDPNFEINFEGIPTIQIFE